MDRMQGARKEDGKAMHIQEKVTWDGDVDKRLASLKTLGVDCISIDLPDGPLKSQTYAWLSIPTTLLSRTELHPWRGQRRLQIKHSLLVICLH